MGTCHIQHQGILRMILIFPCLLLIVNNIIVNSDKLLDQGLFLSSILTTRNCCIPFPQHLVAISMNILDSSGAGLVVKHVEDLSKILRLIHRPSITDQEEHHIVCVIFGLYVFIHPDLTQYID
uniref:C5 n=1 Tax=Hollyhock leaf curl virus TaxID=163655 RepID=A0A2Z4FS84_9GEMI|nr:C5 [Hollyhock leaf curl virus]